MLSIAIPGFKTLSLEHLVLDFNGTLAVDGKLRCGVFERINALAGDLRIHILTADTFGHAREAAAGLVAGLTILESADQAEAKLAYVQGLGAERVVAIGNGRNDRLMLRAAALGMVVSSLEGTAQEALAAAHLFVPGIQEALELLEQPRRLIATLRS
jgi:soluble P-type ATPase